MRLLKKGVPFIRDESMQWSFNALKKDLVSSSLLSSLGYNKYFLMYLTMSESTVIMVMVQEDDVLQNHVIYYLSRRLVGPKLNYSHVKKLALKTMHTIQKNLTLHPIVQDYYDSNVNPFQYVLTWQIIGVKYNKRIIILQEFELDFVFAKSKKSLFFTQLMSEFPCEDENVIITESFPNNHIFLISYNDPWYMDILVYLQTLNFSSQYL